MFTFTTKVILKEGPSVPATVRANNAAQAEQILKGMYPTMVSHTNLMRS